MIVFDRDGKFLRSWGEGTFPRAHGLHIDADDILYLTDDGGHSCASAHRRQGAARARRAGKTGAVHERRAVPPLHAHGALAQGRDLRERRLRQRAGAQVLAGRQAACFPGASRAPIPGQFNIAHNIVTDAEGWVYVADRENHRVQVFDGNGKYETQWVNMHRPCGLYCCRGKQPPQFIIGELGPGMAVNRSQPNIGPRLSHRGRQGKDDRAPRRRGGAGPGGRQIHRAARPRGRFARRHLRRRGELHGVSRACSRTRRSRGACARCRSCSG